MNRMMLNVMRKAVTRTRKNHSDGGFFRAWRYKQGDDRIEIQVSLDLDRRGRLIVRKLVDGRLLSWHWVGNTNGRGQRAYSFVNGFSHPISDPMLSSVWMPCSDAVNTEIGRTILRGLKRLYRFSGVSPVGNSISGLWWNWSSPKKDMGSGFVPLSALIENDDLPY